MMAMFARKAASRLRLIDLLQICELKPCLRAGLRLLTNPAAFRVGLLFWRTVKGFSARLEDDKALQLAEEDS